MCDVSCDVICDTTVGVAFGLPAECDCYGSSLISYFVSLFYIYSLFIYSLFPYYFCFSLIIYLVKYSTYYIS